MHVVSAVALEDVGCDVFLAGFAKTHPQQHAAFFELPPMLGMPLLRQHVSEGEADKGSGSSGRGRDPCRRGDTRAGRSGGPGACERGDQREPANKRALGIPQGLAAEMIDPPRLRIVRQLEDGLDRLLSLLLAGETQLATGEAGEEEIVDRTLKSFIAVESRKPHSP